MRRAGSGAGVGAGGAGVGSDTVVETAIGGVLWEGRSIAVGGKRLCCSLIDEEDGVCWRRFGLGGIGEVLCGMEYG